jgi:MYXO-CTERM domain-containing protein
VTVTVDGENDLDGGAYRMLCNLQAAPYTCEWDTTGESDGQYLLNVAAIDDQGNTTYEWVLVNVSQSASSPCPGPNDGGAVDGGAGDAGLDAGGGGHDASVQDSGSPMATDSGAEAGPTMVPDAGGGGGSHSSSGCGCRVVDDRSSPAAAASALALLLGLAVRRRRRS